jgi:hypothetical protein
MCLLGCENRKPYSNSQLSLHLQGNSGGQVWNGRTVRTMQPELSHCMDVTCPESCQMLCLSVSVCHTIPKTYWPKGTVCHYVLWFWVADGLSWAVFLSL